MIYQAYIHDKAYNSKPTDFGYISKDITNHLGEYTIEEIASKLAKGHTILPAVMNGERKKANFKSQQILMLDFDNKESKPASMFQILGREFTTKHAAFSYQSFSSTPDQPKFRLVFVLDEPLKSAAQVEAMYIELFKHYPEADIACKDASRLFFGGRQLIEINYNNVLGTEIVADVVEVVKPKKAKKKKTEQIKLDLVIDAEETPNYELIRQGNKEELKKRFSEHSASFQSKVTAKNYLRQLNMRTVLGVPSEGTFKDIFHEEQSPSASIYTHEDDENLYMYKCHSEQHEFCGDLINVVRKLQGTSHNEALDFLMDIMNIEIVLTEKMQEIREQCEMLADAITSVDLKDQYPHINKSLFHYKQRVANLLHIIKNHMYEDSEGNIWCLTFMSLRTLSARLGCGKDAVNNMLTPLILSDWIRELSDDQIPADLLEQLKKTQVKNNQYNRVNVYEFVLLGEDFLAEANKKCEVMVKASYTTRANTKDGLSLTVPALAGKRYKQNTRKGLKKSTTDVREFVHYIALTTIDKKGYIFEKEIEAALAKKFKGKGYSSRKLREIRAEMTDMYNLEKKQLNNDLKAALGIELANNQSRPTVYYPAA